MAGERITLNPITEDSGNAPLELVGLDNSHGIYLLDHQYPEPDKDTQYAEHPAFSGGQPIGPPKHKLGQRPVLKLRIVEPTDPASTNLITNPKAAIDTTGYVASGGGSQTISRQIILNNAAGAVPEAGADTGIYLSTFAAGDQTYIPFAVNSGTTYTASFWLYLESLTAIAVKLQVKNASGTDKAATSNQTTIGSWTRISVTFTADSTGNWRLAAEQVGAGRATLFITGLLAEARATLGSYFDGDSPGCSFSSTRHASTSNRPAPGGDRYWAIKNDLDNALSVITQRQYGTYRRIPREGSTHTFDLTESNSVPSEGIVPFRCEYDIVFTSQPYARMPQVTGSTNTETSNPVLVWTQDAPAGDVPALGILTVNELQGANQGALLDGLQVETYDSATTAKLFYECESLTPLGTSATDNGPTGASGPSNPKTILAPMSTTWRALMSTQASGSGAHMTHKGIYGVWLRVQDIAGNTGALQFRLAWSEGDFIAFTKNPIANYYYDSTQPTQWGGTWRLLYLGVIRITADQWQGRILGKSDAVGMGAHLDYLYLQPLGENAGVITPPTIFEDPTSYSFRDEFNQTAGNLGGKTADAGGTWGAGSGDAQDFVVETTGKTLQRTATSDATNTGRWADLGSTNYTNVVLQVDMKVSAVPTSGLLLMGLTARSQGFMALLSINGGTQTLKLYRPSWVLVQSVSIPTAKIVAASTYYTLRAAVLSNGRYYIWFWQTSTNVPGDPLMYGYKSVYETGGSQQTGTPGLYDEYSLASALTRTYDNYIGFVPNDNPAIMASQSAQRRYDGAKRENSAGTFWVPETIKGDLLTIPPATREKRTLRMSVKGVRHDPAIGPDSAIDDISAQLDVIPRVLHVPKPS